MQEIKLHQPVIDTIIVCLKSVLEEQNVADKEVAAILKQNKSFGSRDRSIIAETVYDILWNGLPAAEGFEKIEAVLI